MKYSSSKSKAKLYIGDRDSAAFLQLRSRSCAHVVNCQEDQHGLSRENDIEYLNCDPDVDPNYCFINAIKFIDSALTKGHNVTVLCQNGLGKSAVLVLYYLMQKNSSSLADSHRLLTKTRKNKSLNIKPDLMNLLISEEKKLRKKISVRLDGRKVVYLDEIPGVDRSKKRVSGGGSVLIPLTVFVVCVAALYGILLFVTGKA